jgi:hypothetical protein
MRAGAWALLMSMVFFLSSSRTISGFAFQPEAWSLKVEVTAWGEKTPVPWRSLKAGACKVSGQCDKLAALVREWKDLAAPDQDACAGVVDADCYTLRLKTPGTQGEFVFKSPVERPRLCQIGASGDLICRPQELHPAQQILFELQLARE